jgi:hypothetical protein
MIYRVGDRVVGNGQNIGNGFIAKPIGTVMYVSGGGNTYYGVEFDENVGGWEGDDGILKNGHGWNCQAYLLSHLEHSVLGGSVLDFNWLKK